MTTDNLITLRSGVGHAFVFVHPASGLSIAFRRLIPYLAGRGAVYAFENAEPVGAPPSIGELAASYWAQLQSVAPERLMLAGWSFGGAVALELARLAENADRDVSAVALLDAGAPQLLRTSPPLQLHDLAGLFGISVADLPDDAAVASDAALLEILAEALRRTRRMHSVEVADLEPFVATYRWHHAVMRKPWTHAGQRAPVVLIRARAESGWDDAPPDLGWTSVLGAPPTTLWSPGTHYSLLSEEHAPELARALSTFRPRKPASKARKPDSPPVDSEYA